MASAVAFPEHKSQRDQVPVSHKSQKDQSNPNRRISEEERSQMAKEIATQIYKKFFLEDDETSLQKKKILENVSLSLLSMLSKDASLKNDLFEKRKRVFIKLYVIKYVSSIVSKGLAGGLIAAQSLVQPITQAVLKSQHSTGRKQDGGSTTLIDLNRLKVSRSIINVHLKKKLRNHEKNVELTSEETLKLLRQNHEEVRFEDILTSDFGDARYSPDLVTDDYIQNRLLIYLNKQESYTPQKGNPLYKFIIDKDKLEDAGISPAIVIFKLAVHSEDVLVAIHPLSAYRFDLLPGNKGLTAFLQFIGNLMKVQIKGINGVEVIQEKKVTAKDAIKFIHYEPDKEDPENIFEGVSYLYVLPEALLTFPKHELIERVVKPLTKEEKDELNYHKAIARAENEQAKFLHPAIVEDIEEFLEKKEQTPKMSVEKRDALIAKWSEKLLPWKLDLIQKWRKTTWKTAKEIKRTPAELEKDGEQIRLTTKTKEPLRLIFKGKVELSKRPYSYHVLFGQVKMADIVKEVNEQVYGNPEPTTKLASMASATSLSGKQVAIDSTSPSKSSTKPVKPKSLVDIKYLISNDAREMVNFVGRTAARVNHEYLYSVELTASKSTLLYQHVSLVCRNIFRSKLNPITPDGFLKSPGISSLDRMSFQNYQKNLSAEMIKAQKAKSESLTTSILLGRPPKLGTNFIEFKKDESTHDKIVELYSKARSDKRYLGKYADVKLPPIGILEIKTKLKSISLPGDDIVGL